MGYINIPKFDKICKFKYTYSDLDVCNFCVPQNANNLNMISCMFVG
jgi:hypothetical protein